MGHEEAPRLSVSNAKKNWLNLNSSCLHAKIRDAVALGFKARQIVLIKKAMADRDGQSLFG
jgi:hypothetical protein